MTLIVSSYFIEVLGEEYVDLEISNFLGRFGEGRQNLFPKQKGKKEQDSKQDK
jgi:hypothetical protein